MTCKLFINIKRAQVPIKAQLETAKFDKIVIFEYADNFLSDKSAMRAFQNIFLAVYSFAG